MTLAMTGLAGPAQAQGQGAPAPRVAPQAVYDIAPSLGAYTDEVLFGEVWRREGLIPRDRSLVTVSALIANGRAAQLRGHVGRALDNGVRPEEIAEIITHLAFYAGWPVAISAVQETKAVFEQRDIGTPVPATAPLSLDEAAEARRRAAVQASAGAVAPPLADLTNRVLFGDLWRRPTLAPRDRSLVTIAALIANGQAEQMPFHVNRAMDAGLTEAQLSEVVTHLAFYAGWPRSMSAVPVVQKILAERAKAAAPQTGAGAAIRIQRHGGQPSATGPASNFTGTVRVESRFQAESPARVGGGVVSFEPGARTAWHAHPLGQTLIVTSGCGWVQQEGGPVQEIRPGDVVWFPPGIKHWHGATPNSAMSHVAVAEAQDGTSTVWMEHVTDDQYAQGSSIPGGCRT
ncbi:4-carboxymuconolactone decarboxylase [Roseomonas pecuniae]|uniref:4-carboxymuconolactone decarboxylase n=2 Tax=Muricoccus pecuniae TaxID=693023 RepID=A0A840YMZ4_9PROT|nr:4-carboxymuconolactone decarboxylase [Roseomonas pecuniae]